MIIKLRNSKFIKVLSVFIALNFLVELFSPLRALAITGGPSAPEVQSFEPVGTNQMVDLFSGDFNYNIPLMDVGGYPINLSYHAGINMEQQASWTGLGWNINPGVINRNMRGLPDDFKGDVVKNDMYIEPSRTGGVQFSLEKKEIVGYQPYIKEEFGFDLETGFGNKNVFAFDDIAGNPKTVNLGIYYNNYRGMGYEFGMGSQKESGWSKSIGFNSQTGVDIDASYDIGSLLEEKLGDGRHVLKSFRKISTGFNSRQGIKGVGLGFNYNQNSKSPIKYSGNYTFSTATYTPNVTPNTHNRAYSFKFKLGREKNYKFKPAGIRGYYREGGIDEKATINSKAYGYLYNEHATGSDAKGDENLMDFNRDGIEEINKNTRYLPTANNTFDVYAVSGQGTGGVYKPCRGSVGLIGDPAHRNNGLLNNIHPGLELGSGVSYLPPPALPPFNTVVWSKIGVDVILGGSHERSNKWQDYNYSYDKFIHAGMEYGSSYEPVYFKAAGEKNSVDWDYYSDMMWEAPVRVQLGDDAFSVWANNKWAKTNAHPTDETFQPISTLKRTRRDKRNQVIQYLTAKEATEFGLHKKIETYSTSQVTNYDPTFNSNIYANALPFFEHNYMEKETDIDRVGSFRKEHHLSEITVLNNGGMRYVYGIPLYNTKQIETTFNSGDKTSDCTNKGIITYQSADNSFANDEGIDHYVHKTEIPAYAYAYLLTDVLSSNYVDRTGDGPSPDDIGTYTKFNYSSVTSEGNMYKWRSPYTGANHIEGLSSNGNDDKASFIYGEKEIRYLHSIETKTHIAYFHTSDRDDNCEAQGIDGGLPSMANTKGRKLDKIVLYAREDFERNGLSAKKIKTVHFEYSYDLCKNVDNFYQRTVAVPDHPLQSFDAANYTRKANDFKGKLTLHKVYFTYGDIETGEFNPYVFEYKGSNPDYSRSYDRWGNYKPNLCGLINSEFPYVDQNDRATADINAGVWSLTDIRLPSGGNIKITYEADDYAYVQNKKAMQMAKLKGFASSKLANPISTYLSDKLYTDHGYNNYIYFHVPSSVTDVKQVIPDDMELLYFNCFTDVDADEGNSIDPGSNRHEYINGYAAIEEKALLPNTAGENIVMVKMRGKRKGDRTNNEGNVNPIAKQAWQYVRLHMSYLAYPGTDSKSVDDDGMTEFARGLLSFIPSVLQKVVGFNNWMKIRGYGNQVNLSKSWVRMTNPDGFKVGGGNRVQKIEISDDWNSMSTEQTATYGQTYVYTTEDENGNTISSGVASYEPTIGGDENPWRMPIYDEYDPEQSVTKYEYKKLRHFLAPDHIFYDEGPIGESFFPGASVGYSKVTVKNIEDPSAKRHATGKTVHEFYTAKIFPTVVKNTRLDLKIRNNYGLKLLGINKTVMTGSQGFSIELNDMHGKPMKQSSYAEGASEPLSSIEYIYKSDKREGDEQQLTNNVRVIKKDGTLGDAVIGLDIEMAVDPREKVSRSYSLGVELNFDNALVIPPPPLVPVPAPAFSMYPSFDYGVTKVRTISTTKIVNRSGILDKTIIMNNEGKIERENLAWDEETGEVLLTTVQNEFSQKGSLEDNDYILKQPAHWAYEGMSGAYKNVGAIIKVTVDPDGRTTNPSNLLTPGDELIPYDGIANPYTSKIWVLDEDKVLNRVSLIKANGEKIPAGDYELKVLRSGHRNSPTASIGQLVYSKDPVQNDKIAGASYAYDDVLGASAMEYSDNWQTWFQWRYMLYKQTACEGTYGFKPGHFKIERGELCQNLLPWQSCGALCGSNLLYPGDVANPYVLGVRGNWLPWKSYSYYDRNTSTALREQSISSNNYNNTNTRVDGDIKSFVPFWEKPVNNNEDWVATSTKDDITNPWTWMEESQTVGPNGQQGQINDALEIKSSALYGYDNKMPIASAQNAAYKDILFDGFEDYYDDMSFGYECQHPLIFESSSAQEFYSRLCATPRHWDIWTTFFSWKASIDNQNSHTGYKSLKIMPQVAEPVTDQFGNVLSYVMGPNIIKVPIEPIPMTLATDGPTPISEYHLKDEDFLGVYSPGIGDHIVSFWVKETNKGDLQFRIDDKNTPGNYMTLTPIETQDVVIDGWRRIEYQIDLTTDEFVVEFENNTVDPIYIDDIRFHPKRSVMKAQVYDYKSLKLMSSLDQNNFATLYEYDKEGKLVRVKKETKDGVVTIQENRSHMNNID